MTRRATAPMPAEAAAGPLAAFAVPPWIDALGGFVERHRALWIRLGDLETRLLSDALADIGIEAPIYVAGLARSGSTILLESLAAADGTATHRYRDYPPVFVPFFWSWLVERMPQRPAAPVERTHGDGIAVTAESAEAFEEMLWMAFFPRLHDPATSAVLDASTTHPAFERFYRAHIRKLLLARQAGRYVAKGNYNLTRLEYLLKLFPDARFVLPVREPLWHIASLAKQHALFCAGERQSPAALAHLRRVGHFEFGLDRRAINAGDRDAVAGIAAAWARGEEVEGWARCWAMLHDHLADRLAGNARLREACLVVRFEELCAAPQAMVARLLDHCRLPAPDDLVARLAARLRFPAYYAPRFTVDERAVIGRWTAGAAARFGYAGDGRINPL